jgi:hypothetical protein
VILSGINTSAEIALLISIYHPGTAELTPVAAGQGESATDLVLGSSYKPEAVIPYHVSNGLKWLRFEERRETHTGRDHFS